MARKTIHPDWAGFSWQQRRKIMADVHRARLEKPEDYPIPDGEPPISPVVQAANEVFQRAARRKVN
jgi:hypothetical protein